MNTSVALKTGLFVSVVALIAVSTSRAPLIDEATIDAAMAAAATAPAAPAAPSSKVNDGD